jgi:ATP adenylyltransferase/5',5'''-P-1,P-4-tetraphosphate phosphorylase II
MMYFNCGFNSGASVPHKHMQVIPYASLFGGTLPFEEAAADSKDKTFMLPEYQNIKHLVCSLSLNGVDLLSREALPDDLEAYLDD